MSDTDDIVTVEIDRRREAAMNRMAIRLYVACMIIGGVAGGGWFLNAGCKALSHEQALSSAPEQTGGRIDSGGNITSGLIDQSQQQVTSTVQSYGSNASTITAIIILGVVLVVSQVGTAIALGLMVFHFRYRREKQRYEHEKKKSVSVNGKELNGQV